MLMTSLFHHLHQQFYLICQSCNRFPLKLYQIEKMVKNFKIQLFFLILSYHDEEFLYILDGHSKLYVQLPSLCLFLLDFWTYLKLALHIAFLMPTHCSTSIVGKHLWIWMLIIFISPLVKIICRIVSLLR